MMRSDVAEKISFLKLCIFCIVYAAFYTLCLFENHMGITYPIFVIGTIICFIYYMRTTGRTVKRFSYFYYSVIAILGTNICLTSSSVLIAFDKAFIFVLFFMLFLHNLYDDVDWDVSRYIEGIIKLCFGSLGFLFRPVSDLWGICKNYFVISKGDEQIQEREKVSVVGHNLGYVFIGLAISIPLVCIILPLLLSSDIIFSNAMGDIFSFRFDYRLFQILYMIIVVFFCAYALVYRLTVSIDSLKKEVVDKRKYSPIIAITVNIVLLAIYMMYSIIQIVFLFMRKGQLPEGYTYTKYAHEGFFQLVFVCLINIVLVLICRKFSKDSIALKIVLCMISGCTYIMICSSAYRMYLYIDAYKLTFLRIYVLWALLVMAVVMAGIIRFLFNPGMKFVRFVTVSVICLWIGFICINPDYMIAKYNIRYHDDDDYICELSLDAVPAIEKYGDAKVLLEKYCNYSSGNVSRYKRKSSLREALTFRTWNYSIWKASNIVKEYNIYDMSDKAERK